jgi:DNA-directed RNA polymerase specialized sigma24 family protein
VLRKRPAVGKTVLHDAPAVDSISTLPITTLGVTTMATSFSSVSFTPSPRSASWCFLLLEHLDEFTKLAWYLVADGKLVEDTFARTMAKLDTTAFASPIPALAYSQARDVLITQAIAVLSDARREEDENRFFHPNPSGSLPDHPRLAFMLKLIIRSSEAEVARFLGVSQSEVQGLVKHAIDRLSVVPPIYASTDCYDA